MRFTLKNVPISFPNVYVATAMEEGQKKKFNCKAVVKPNHPQIPEMESIMLQVAEAKWPGKGKKFYDAMVKTGRKPEVFFVKEPYSSAKTGDPYDGFEGNYYVTASSEKKPTVVDRDTTPLTAEDGVIYAGAITNLILDIWAQDNRYGKAIRADLKGVQFVRDGEAFGGSGPAAKAEDFEDLSEQGDDEVSESDFA